MDNVDKQKLTDFEILSKITKKELQISEIDEATKRRLIELCKEQLKSVEQKIKKEQEIIDQLEKIIKDSE